jgi:hypothetical protein
MEGCVLSFLKADDRSSGFRGGDLKKLANQKQELPVEGHVW